jgi:hypothetical protein
MKFKTVFKIYPIIILYKVIKMIRIKKLIIKILLRKLLILIYWINILNKKNKNKKFFRINNNIKSLHLFKKYWISLPKNHNILIINIKVKKI